jgi:hypothetical protein
VFSIFKTISPKHLDRTVYVLYGCPVAQRCNGYWVVFTTERKCVYCADHEPYYALYV